MDILVRERSAQRAHMNNSLPVRVKMFASEDHNRVEQELNEWFAVSDIMIRHITQSECERNGRLHFVVSVFFTQASYD